MTNDEKAKAYDMALEAARKELGVDRKEWKVVQRVLHNIFPELAESEDERMMREFNDWLCEEIECRTDDLRDEKDRKTLNMLCYVLAKVKDWLEKQKEPTKEELYAEAGTTEKEYIANTMKMVRAMREKKQEQKPAEWSEEDEATRIEVIKLLSNPSLYEVCEHLREESVDWLKTLHTKVNVNSEKVNANSEKVNVNWSEEDKMAIDRACVALRAYANGDLPEFLPSELIGYADRLQSLRPGWKPTEEQMEALKRAIDACESEWAYQDDELRSLLNDLKKL